MKIENLKNFLDQPGINVSGICQEAELDPSYLRKILIGKRSLTQDIIKKLEPVLICYGFEVRILKTNFNLKYK